MVDRKTGLKKPSTVKKATKVAEKEVRSKEKEGTQSSDIGAQISEKKVVVEPEQKTEDREQTTPEPKAKAGKKSEKGIKEAEEKVAKEERKAHATEAKTAEEAPKKEVIPARPRIERRSKNFKKAAELIEKDKEYSLKEAVELAAKTSPVKFDATVEMHINLGVDPKQADQNIRDTIVLPAGTGKKVRIAVFADADGITTAKAAGADIAGNEDFLAQLDKGTINFDVLIAPPTMMAKLGKYAKVLGPKGLMPNPKSGTVATDIKKAVTEAKGGRVEYRVDTTGIVHVGMGKVSFGGEKLLQNAQALLTSIKSNKPASVKGVYVKAIHITTSMGPSIKIATSEI